MITIGDREAKTAELRIPWEGSWEFSGTARGAALTGEVSINWRGWRILGGEVDPAQSGTFATDCSLTIVGGLRWSTLLAPRFYQDDRGLRVPVVAADLAAAANLPLADAPNRLLGRSWARRAESAGTALSRLFGWYVGLDGVTRALPRPAAILGRSVAVLNYDPTDGVVELYADRPDEVPLGAVLPADARFPSPRLIIEVRVLWGDNKERITAYTQPIQAPAAPRNLGPIVVTAPLS